MTVPSEDAKTAKTARPMPHGHTFGPSPQARSVIAGERLAGDESPHDDDKGGLRVSMTCDARTIQCPAGSIHDRLGSTLGDSRHRVVRDIGEL
jgi:hypothetical protein